MNELVDYVTTNPMTKIIAGGSQNRAQLGGNIDYHKC